ncbi:MAG TPA: S41 family peptidase [Blastocatellia bacterium]|nr:S41 family peptidase [Blastocatellia bacterium]
MAKSAGANGLAALQPWGQEPCGDECVATVEQAMLLLDQACVHLPLKRRRGVGPVEQLRDLRARLPETRAQFYRELLAIFAKLGDRHTQCHLPEPWASHVVYLPFLVRAFFQDGHQRLAVVGSAVEGLERGDTLIAWNEQPMRAVLRQHMTQQLGANREARLAKAVQTLTFRPLASMPPPEGAVGLEVEGNDGRRRKLRLEWQLAEHSWLIEHVLPRLNVDVEHSDFSSEGLRARVIETNSGTFGHIRVASFHARPDQFLPAFVAALETLPRAGLVLDLRGCEDGIIQTAERLLQLFTAAPIEPQPFQFRITDLIREMVQSAPALRTWRDPVEQAARRRRRFSIAQPLTSPNEANAVGQKYQGPVVVLVDALTYSSAEMFAAGFQDHGIGLVMGTARRTGGGGASPWHQAAIHQLSGKEVFRPRPGSPTLRVAVRRCQRVHARSGQPIEGIGVTPDVVYLPTRDNLFNKDRDLLEKVGALLAQKIFPS